MPEMPEFAGAGLPPVSGYWFRVLGLGLLGVLGEGSESWVWVIWGLGPLGFKFGVWGSWVWVYFGTRA